MAFLSAVLGRCHDEHLGEDGQGWPRAYGALLEHKGRNSWLLEAVRAGEQGPGGRPVASWEAENPNHGKAIAGESKYKDTRYL